LHNQKNDKIFGARSSKNLQIGNAVPSFLVIALKDSIKKHLQIDNKT